MSAGDAIVIDPYIYIESRRKFISGWRFSLLTQYFYNRHLTRIYKGILDDHFTCDEKEKLKPLAAGMNKSIEEAIEDFNSKKWFFHSYTIFTSFLFYWFGLQCRKRKYLLDKWKWYSYNIIWMSENVSNYPSYAYLKMTETPYLNGTMNYTESIDPKLFKDFKDITNKEYYKRHLAIENQTPFIVENSRIVDRSRNSQTYIRKAVSDSFVIMEELKEQERQLEAFSKGEVVEKDKKEK